MSVKNKFSLNVGTGAPSLLTIFLILSLISFSVLSFMTSKADLRFAQSLEAGTTAFYTASNESEIKVSQIRITLRDLYEELSTSSEFTNSNHGSSDDIIFEAINVGNRYSAKEELFLIQAREALSEYDIDENNLLTFSTTINENQDLIVSLQLTPPSSSNGDFFLITRWQVVQTGEWIPDNRMDLL